MVFNMNSQYPRGQGPDGHRYVQQKSAPRQLTPQQIAARRAYLARRRKQIRRNRIILGCVCVLILLLLVLLTSLIIRSIIGNGDHNDGVGSDTDTVQTDVVGTGNPDSGSEGTDSTDDSSQTDDPVPQADLSYAAMGFVSDLKDYEKYMNPEEDRDAYLILVNSKNPLSSKDIPDDLVDVVNTRKDGRDAQQMRRAAARALEALYIEAQAQGMLSPDTPSGYPLSVTSGYRSYATQNYLFTQYTQNEMTEHPTWTKEQAEAEVLTYSCRPGTSEHQTGLSCDMHTLSGADVSFANYEQAAWLAENGWKFGFILRFPEDKVNETGISYEPWHFRYVGRYHAYRIWSEGLCLEEYLANTTK